MLFFSIILLICCLIKINFTRIEEEFEVIKNNHNELVTSQTVKKVNEIIDVVFWSSGAIAFYKKGSLFFIFNLTMSVISLIFMFL